MADVQDATTATHDRVPVTPDDSLPASPDGSGDELADDGTVGTAAVTAPKKKKKKRKSAAQKRAVLDAAAAAALLAAAPQQSVLKISRNKHMKYISSYHGPWLQLPLEILQSLLTVNCNPDALPTLRGLVEAKRNLHDRVSRKSIQQAPPSSSLEALAYQMDIDERLPPPLDPAVFRGITTIRQLVDEASDIAVRAASGLSAAAFGALNLSGGMGGGGETVQGGRNPAMSPVRQHRLRCLAVAKLAEAYKIDEIAASVAVMQGSTSLEDLAQRVLKYDPTSLDAQYVHFFHEKIPSRTLATSTETDLLDHLILSDPHRLEYYRTRGIVHGFKSDFPSAIRDFTQALTLARAARKAKQYHAGDTATKASRKKGKSTKHSAKDGTDSTSPSTPLVQETTFGKEAGDDLERQMLFHRAMAHFHFACKIIEDAVMDIEGVAHPQGGFSNEGGELTLRNVGIHLKDEVVGLYGCASATKQARYRAVLGDPALKDKVTTLLRKCIRDQERFLASFPVWEAPTGSLVEEEMPSMPNPRSTERPLAFRGRRLIHHRSLCGRTRHSDPRRADSTFALPTSLSNEPALLVTYHPLLVEANFSVLLSHLLLGDFSTPLVAKHYRVVRPRGIMDFLEGYPVLLPPRSLCQSEYAELLERLAVTFLKTREDSGISTPKGNEEEVVHEGDLPSLHHLLSFFTDSFVESIIEAAEFADQEGKEEAKSKAASGNRLLALMEKQKKEKGGEKGSWAEEREKAEAERRKYDPSYGTHNTARAEVALAWLTAVILPEKEAEETVDSVKGKGKATTEGSTSRDRVSPSGSGSGSRAMYEEEEED